MLEDAGILSNERFQGDYWRIIFRAPGVCPLVHPGQFVHVRISQLRDRVLRRPFSICDVSGEGTLTVVYKVVGEGTNALSHLRQGQACNLMGPQGMPFTLPNSDETPVIVAGGYGAAATYLLASRAPRKGILLLGARSSQDIILADAYKEAGFSVRMATEDGSAGTKGRVTVLLESLLGENIPHPRFYACGPHGMLIAAAKSFVGAGYNNAELSLDHLMCCGVGACFACVVRVKDTNSPDGWRYARTCSEGPVFDAGDICI